MLNKIIFLLLIINLVKSENLYYSNILECNYNFESDNYKSRMTLTIDGNRYRETVTYPGTNSYFSVPVKRKDFNISYHIDGSFIFTPQVNCKYTQGFVLGESMDRKNIVINKNLVSLFKADYFHDKKHLLNVHILISAKPLTIKEPELEIELYFNGEIKTQNGLSPSYPGLSYKLQLNGDIGMNNIDIFAITNGTWCSCPTIKDGFNNNRYIFAWISDLDENNNKINTNIENVVWISNSINSYEAKYIGLDMLNTYGEIVTI